MANTPVDKIQVGPVTLSVWENVVTKGKDEFTNTSVSFQKSYKDKDGKWQTSQSFKDSELLYVIMACQERLKRKYLKEEISEVDVDLN